VRGRLVSAATWVASALSGCAVGVNTIRGHRLDPGRAPSSSWGNRPACNSEDFPAPDGATTTYTPPFIKARDQLRGQLIPAEKPSGLLSPEGGQSRIRTLLRLCARLAASRTTNTVQIVQVQVPASLVHVSLARSVRFKANRNPRILRRW
jgi:hypothetical protein